MSYYHKHTNLPMKMLESIGKEGWYGHHTYYFGMDGYSAILFSRFHGSHGKDFSESCDRLDTLHDQKDHNPHPAVGRPAKYPRTRCLPPLLSRRRMGKQSTLETSGDFAGEDLLPSRHHFARRRRYGLSSHRQESQWCRLVERCGSFYNQPGSICVGTESGDSNTENPSAMERPAYWIANQHESASKKWSHIDRAGRANAPRSYAVVPRKAVSRPLRRFLRSSGRLWYRPNTYHQQNETRCEHIRIACQTKNKETRQTPQKRKKAGLSATYVQACRLLEEGESLRTRQGQEASALFSHSIVVQGQAKARTSGHQPGPEGQRERQLFLYDRHYYATERASGELFRPLVYRRDHQTDQAGSRRPSASDAQTYWSRTRSHGESLAVLDGLVVVFEPAKILSSYAYSSVV